MSDKSDHPIFRPGRIIIDREFNALCNDVGVSKEYTFRIKIRESIYAGEIKDHSNEDFIFIALFKKKRLLITYNIPLSQFDELGSIADLISEHISDRLDVLDVELLSDLSDISGIVKFHYRKQ